MQRAVIENVGDTAFWVAAYRVLESQRKDALFQDDIAARLVGAKGLAIAEVMPRGTANAVIVRNEAMDALILEALANHPVDAVVNLGCGLDTRAFRLPLAKTLAWYEVDFPDMISHKKDVIVGVEVRCRLSLVSLDLRDDTERRAFLRTLNEMHRCILVITEGVLYYLDDAENRALAADLQAFAHFQFWVQDYLSLEFGKYFSKRLKGGLNQAPFKFMPEDWVGYFKNLGWDEAAHRYTLPESRRLNRPLNYDGIYGFFRLLLRPAQRQRLERLAGYVLFRRSR